MYISSPHTTLPTLLKVLQAFSKSSGVHQLEKNSQEHQLIPAHSLNLTLHFNGPPNPFHVSLSIDSLYWENYPALFKQLAAELLLHAPIVIW